MRLLAIPDLHGKTTWQDIDPHAYDKLIFLGDYVDSKDPYFSDQDQYANLLAIIRFRQTYPGKVVLLLGNHDIHYHFFPHFRGSGFRPEAAPALVHLFTQYQDLFRVAYQAGNWLFTHAGVSAGWWDWMQTKTTRLPELTHLPLADRLNALLTSPENRYLHTVSRYRGGPNLHGGPTWADFEETSTDLLPGYHQVVGHTPQPAIRTYGKAESSITYTDILGRSGPFWEGIISSEKQK